LRAEIVHLGEEFEVHLGGQRLVKPRGIREYPNPLADLGRLADHIVAAHRSPPLGGRYQAGEDAHRGGLPRSVGAEHTENFSLPDADRKVTNRPVITI
jgi:hypothetical protein